VSFQKCEQSDKKIEGSINGSSSSSSSYFLGIGGGYSSGSLNGKIDTNEVNKCNDCGHEWKVSKLNLDGVSDVSEVKLSFLRLYYQHIKEYENATFDPNDITEKYSSLQEKKESLLKKVESNLWKTEIQEFWGKYSIELYLKLMEVEKYRTYQHMEFLDRVVPMLESLGIRHIDEFLNKNDEK